MSAADGNGHPRKLAVTTEEVAGRVAGDLPAPRSKVDASAPVASLPPLAEHFPSSRKILVDAGDGLRVPVREVALQGGAAPLRLYDTTGPEGHDVKQGLPRLRQPWIDGRLAQPR
jgi:phosphomethylpyrimidine synthase